MDAIAQFFYPIRRLTSGYEQWLIGLTLLSFFIILISFINTMRKSRGTYSNCQRCKYDLRASTNGTCPECGLETARLFRFRYCRPYVGIAALIAISVCVFFVSWDRVWIGLRIMTGYIVNVHDEIDLGHGIVVQDCTFICTGSDMYGEVDRSVRVLRSGDIVYDKWLFSSAEYYKIEDLNGNGTLDFRYGYGRQGSGSYEYSEIIDPLYEKIFEVESEFFKDLNGDGILECYDRDDQLVYHWNYGIDKLRVHIVKSWNPKYGAREGWVADIEATRTPPPTNEEFQQDVETARENLLKSIAKDGTTYLGAIAPCMVSYCYSGHPALAFEFLDLVWQEGEEAKLAFEHDFIETLRHAEFVEVTTKFGFFDEAGKRACNRVASMEQ